MRAGIRLPIEENAMTTFVDTHAPTALQLRTVTRTTERTLCRFHEWLIRIGTAVGASPPSDWRDRSPSYGPAGPVLILRSDSTHACPMSLSTGCRASAFAGQRRGASTMGWMTSGA